MAFMLHGETATNLPGIHLSQIFVVAYEQQNT